VLVERLVWSKGLFVVTLGAVEFVWLSACDLQVKSTNVN